MSIVAEKYEYVIGVDTHARTHSYAVLESGTGRVCDCSVFPVTGPGILRALAWARRRVSGSEFLAAVEGTNSYGASLTRAWQAAGITVTEAKPPRRTSRRQRGKSDQIDAIAAARSVLAADLERLIQPRRDGVLAALRVLLTGRHSLDSRRTADRNALTALLRSINLGIDVRAALTDRQLREVAAWRARSSDDAAATTIRAEARRLAVAVLTATTALRQNRDALDMHVQTLAPDLQDLAGVGPVSAAIVLTAYSYQGRIHSEAAFARLAGVAPIPASSGNITRHRLSRGGDRQLNRAIDTIVRSRLNHDPATRDYFQRRTAQGRTRNEIKRSLKRYVARQIFRQLNALTT